MGKLIVRLAEDRYVDWSTVCDAPVTGLMTRKTAEQYVREQVSADLSMYPCDEKDQELSELQSKYIDLVTKRRLDRADQYGTSSINGTTLESLLTFNRAGPGGQHLGSIEEILKVYTKYWG